MIFGKRKRKSGMDPKSLRSLDGKAVKYVTERDGDTFREIRAGNEGAINISADEFTVVCGGVNAIRCRLGEVSAAELMNRSGLVIRGFDLDRQTERTVTAYYSDGTVSADRKK